MTILFIVDYKNPLYDEGRSLYPEVGDYLFVNDGKVSVVTFKAKAIFGRDITNQPGPKPI